MFPEHQTELCFQPLVQRQTPGLHGLLCALAGPGLRERAREEFAGPRWRGQMSENEAGAPGSMGALDSLISDILPGENVLPGSVWSADAACPEQRVAACSRPGDGDGPASPEQPVTASSRPGDGDGPSQPAPAPGTPTPYSSETVAQTQRRAEMPPASRDPPASSQPPVRRESSKASPAKSRDWRRDRQAVDSALIRSRILLFAVGALGMFLSVVVNELIFREADPRSGLIEFLKTCNLFLSLCMLGLFVRHYMLKELMLRITMHLKALFPLDTNVAPNVSLRDARFWVEVTLCLPCLPPFCTFEIVTLNWQNTIMYRAETFFCVYHLFRIYLIWPVVRDRFLTALPRRYTIASFTNSNMNSAFAFKGIMNGPAAIAYVGFFWVLSIFVTGYWFRAAEVSACLFSTAVSPECNYYSAKHWVAGSGFSAAEKTNDLYIWNALWGVFITATSVGYGDILATTHLGRCVMFISAMVGLISVAAITASMSVVLMWNEHEQSAELLIQREKARRDIAKLAAKLIQCFFRSKKGRKAGEDAARTRLLHNLWHCKQQFRATKFACQVTKMKKNGMHEKR